MKIAVTIEKARVDKFCDYGKLPKDCELVFAKSPRVEDMKDCLDSDVLYVNAMQQVHADIMDRMPNLRMIHSEGVAFDKIDVEYAKAKGIYVCNARGANAGQVAEQTILLILNVLHRFEEGSNLMKAGLQKETQSKFIQEGLLDLEGAKVGILGFGAIGKELAKRLVVFGCKLYYYDPLPATAEIEQKYQIERMSFDDILKTCDIVSLHLPVTPETRGIINKEHLSMMKPSAILINTSRGEIVNNEDLVWAIKNDVIYGAGLDTIAPEPVPKDSPILTIEKPYSYRVAISPHIAGTTLSAFRNMYSIFAENVNKIANGEKPVTLV